MIEKIGLPIEDDVSGREWVVMPSKKEIVDKINELIDYLNDHKPGAD